MDEGEFSAGRCAILPTAASDDLGKIDCLGQICGLQKSIVGQIDPRFPVHSAELLRHSGHNSSRHAAMGHYRYYTGNIGVLYPFDPHSYAENCLAATLWGEVLAWI